MSDTGSRSDLAELGREWLAARVIFVAGFVVAIAFAVLWSMTHKPEMASLGEETAMADSGAAAPPSQEGMMACRASIILAENFGVVPNTLKFAGGPNKTDTVGRYTCLADDSAGTRYSVTFDLVCRQLNDARCVSLYNAAKADGTVLYQRQAGSVEAPTAEAPAADTPAEGSADGSSPAADGSPGVADSSGDASGSDNGGAPQQQP